ncbi:hypothetical protein FS749_011731 [Ceratobasidium sp. UAMH 11750]|nr:hypothetical protein FS749_011731 [Ceratobasidium sp. UAMH 11750]
MSETYTIIMRGQTFTLTRDQVEFDSPNYFTSCFLGEFTESRTRTLTISRDPELFKIILDYLSGYEVLPLHTSVIPSRMSPDLALRNLLVDARFYLLDRFIRRIGSGVKSLSIATIDPPPTYLMLTAQNSNSWDWPVPVSEDTTNNMKQKHGLDSHGYKQWSTCHADIENALRAASIQKSYVIETLWVVSTWGVNDCHHVIVKLTR